MSGLSHQDSDVIGRMNSGNQLTASLLLKRPNMAGDNSGGSKRDNLILDFTELNLSQIDSCENGENTTNNEQSKKY